MELQWIDVHEPETGRKSSISFGGKRSMPGCLRIVGGLSHGSEITFDKTNAKKLVKWLNETIIK